MRPMTWPSAIIVNQSCTELSILRSPITLSLATAIDITQLGRVMGPLAVPSAADRTPDGGPETGARRRWPRSDPSGSAAQCQ
eukprot:1861139-Pyramimonas_sp.AAC.1